MSAETKPMVLGGRTFEVPHLPLGVTIKLYPALCNLSNGGFIDRWFGTGPTADDMVELTDVLFDVAAVAEPDLQREAFDALPVTPEEMLQAFLVARYQSGGWAPPPPKPEGDETEPGEGKGAPKSPKSTSAASSES